MQKVAVNWFASATQLATTQGSAFPSPSANQNYKEGKNVGKYSKQNWEDAGKAHPHFIQWPSEY